LSMWVQMPDLGIITHMHVTSHMKENHSHLKMILKLQKMLMSLRNPRKCDSEIGLTLMTHRFIPFRLRKSRHNMEDLANAPTCSSIGVADWPDLQILRIP